MHACLRCANPLIISIGSVLPVGMGAKRLAGKCIKLGFQGATPLAGVLGAGPQSRAA
jgi:hypothetical protein